MKTFLFSFVMAGLLISCDIGPEPIDYGSESCAFCKMTIVDRQHASEIVTDKGRVYKFDAIECMINYNDENPDQKVAMYLISDFKDPGEWVDATNATFLVSPKISSPMGANLSGFSSKENAQITQETFGGELYSWQSLRDFLQNK